MVDDSDSNKSPNKQKPTTVWMPQDVKAELDSRKVIPREAYHSVIRRLLDSTREAPAE